MPIGGGAVVNPPTGIFGGSGSGAGVIQVAPPTGTAVTDQENIQNAVNAAGAAFGGTVQLQAGAYAVSSSVSLVTVSNAGPGTAWTIVSGGPVVAGSYVIGPGVVGSGGTFGRSPKITVGGSSTFTTDIAPGAVMSSVVVWVVSPGILLPEGVKIKGTGGIVGLGTANYFSGTSAKYGTAIIDSGTGVTVLTRGSNSYGSRYGLYDLVVWGGAGAWGGSGYTGNALIGVFISNNSWWFEMNNVDVSYYLTAGIALDGNMNAQDFHNVSIQHIGTIGATTQTGGLLCYFFSGKVTSAGINLYNPSIDNIYGMGIGGGPGGGPGGGSTLAAAVNVYGGQIWDVSSTSLATYSGFGMVCEGDFSSGKCTMNGSWFGTNARGDLWVNGGSVAAVTTTFTSSVSSPITTYGNLTLVGCDVYATSANAVVNNGTVNAVGVALQGSATNLYSGGPTAAECLGVVTSTNARSSSIGLGAVSPSVAGTRSTSPPTNATIQTALGNLSLGTAYQNTLSYDVVMTVYLSITVNTSGVVKLGVGTTNTPTQATIITGVTTIGFVPVKFTIPAGDYALLSISGTITDSIAGQYLEAA